MKTLTLSLKKLWFDMIKSGEKKEEYREIGMFWSVRFLGVTIAKKFNLVDYKFVDAQNIREDLNTILTIDNYDKLIFTLDYPKADDTERRLEFKNPKIRIGEGRPEWGAEPGKIYFVITWEELWNRSAK